MIGIVRAGCLAMALTLPAVAGARGVAPLAGPGAPASAFPAPSRPVAEIVRFPQACLRADRASSYAQWGESIDGALRREGRDGEAVLRQEAIAGAGRFASGAGRGGDFGTI